MVLKVGDYFRLNELMKEATQTQYNYARVDNVMPETIEGTLVEDSEVDPGNTVIVDERFSGKTISLSLAEIST